MSNELMEQNHGPNMPAMPANGLMAGMDNINQGTVAIEASRAIAEAQGKLVIAKRFPRDEVAAYAKAMQVIAILLVLALVIYFAVHTYPAQIEGKPIARVTYYQMPDGSIQTVIENIGDQPLTITQDGFLFPEGEGEPA